MTGLLSEEDCSETRAVPLVDLGHRVALFVGHLRRDMELEIPPHPKSSLFGRKPGLACAPATWRTRGGEGATLSRGHFQAFASPRPSWRIAEASCAAGQFGGGEGAQVLFGNVAKGKALNAGDFLVIEDKGSDGQASL